MMTDRSDESGSEQIWKESRRIRSVTKCMKRKLNIALSCLLLGLFLLLPGLINAEQIPGFDEDVTCTLEILIENEHDQNLPVENADVTLYQVAEVKIVNDQIQYPCTEAFRGYAEALTTVNNDEIADAVFDYAVQHRVSGDTKYTDKNGRTEFSGLKPGIYLVSEITGVTDRYVKFKPFLAVLPYQNEGNWMYRVLAKPKFDTAGDENVVNIRVNKVWNDDGLERPSEVKVQLLQDGEVFDTVVLNASNGWKKEWTELAGKYNWSVKEIDIPAGYTATYRYDGTDFTVCNTRIMIQTGQLNWPIPVLAAAGILFIIIGLLLKRRKKM